MTHQHILVTGGAGFVGSSLSLGFKSRFPDVNVTAFDNLKRRGSELNLPRLKAAGVAFVHGDVRNAEDLAALPAIDLIIECSAEPSVLAGYSESPAYLLNTNLIGTINCLELARRAGAGMIFLSTSRVYPIDALNNLRFREEPSRFTLEDRQGTPGAGRDGISEAFPLEGARSLYGCSKLCSELLIQEYTAAYGMPALINRCGVIAGPWQMGKVDQGVAVLWAARHWFGGKLDYIGYNGSGKQVRDLLHIDDLIDLVLLEAADLPRLSGNLFNVGGGNASSASLVELTALCEELSGRSLRIGRVAQTRTGDVRIYITNNARVTAKTGWVPKRGVRDIMTDCMTWLRSNEDVLKPVLG